MAGLSAPFRHATAADARAMAELVNIAGDGMPLYLWSGMAADGESPWEVGMQRAQREAGSFSFGNTVLFEEDGRVLAALVAYALPKHPDPDVYDDMPPMFVPLQQLEDMVPGTFYINVLAAYEESRGRGVGSQLLLLAEQLGRNSGCDGLSLIVADANTGARRLYERSGFIEIASRPMIKEGWDGAGENWVLLKKPAV